MALYNPQNYAQIGMQAMGQSAQTAAAMRPGSETKYHGPKDSPLGAAVKGGLAGAQFAGTDIGGQALGALGGALGIGKGAAEATGMLGMGMTPGVLTEAAGLAGGATASGLAGMTAGALTEGAGLALAPATTAALAPAATTAATTTAATAPLAGSMAGPIGMGIGALLGLGSLFF